MGTRRKTTSLDEAVENGRGIERPFQCHMHDDTNASASVNVDKGLWYCYACHASGRVDRKGSTFSKDMRIALALLDGSQKAAVYPEEWLDIFDSKMGHPYWLARFGQHTCTEHRLGIDLLTGFPSYPLRNENWEVLGVVLRTGATPKYLYPPNISVSRLLYGFNLAMRTSVAVLTEGAADAIAVSAAVQRLRPRWDIKAYATYGAGLHRPQRAMLQYQAPRGVLMGFDNDEAGRRAATRDYGLKAATAVVQWPQKDPGECTDQQIVTAIEEAADGVVPL